MIFLCSREMRTLVWEISHLDPQPTIEHTCVYAYNIFNASENKRKRKKNLVRENSPINTTTKKSFKWRSHERREKSVKKRKEQEGVGHHISIHEGLKEGLIVFVEINILNVLDAKIFWVFFCGEKLFTSE